MSRSGRAWCDEVVTLPVYNTYKTSSSHLDKLYHLLPKHLKELDVLWHTSKPPERCAFLLLLLALLTLLGIGNTNDIFNSTIEGSFVILVAFCCGTLRCGAPFRTPSHHKVCRRRAGAVLSQTGFLDLHFLSKSTRSCFFLTFGLFRVLILGFTSSIRGETID